jgi:hypothetical protein
MWMEKDGKTLCFVRLATLVGQIAYFILTGLAIKHGQQIDFTVWSAGYVALIVGGAGGALLKLKTEDAPQ